MDSQQRDNLIGKLATRATDDADISTIRDFFFQGQVEILDEKEDEELITLASAMGFDITEYEDE